MGKIFNKKKKAEVEMAAPPVSSETPGEIKEIERLNSPEAAVAIPVAPVAPVAPAAIPVEVPVTPVPEPAIPQIQEVPVCMSQTQINNLIIGLDVKLNYIISKIEEAD